MKGIIKKTVLTSLLAILVIIVFDSCRSYRNPSSPRGGRYGSYFRKTRSQTQPIGRNYIIKNKTNYNKRSSSPGR